MMLLRGGHGLAAQVMACLTHVYSFFVVISPDGLLHVLLRLLSSNATSSNYSLALLSFLRLQTSALQSPSVALSQRRARFHACDVRAGSPLRGRMRPCVAAKPGSGKRVASRLFLPAVSEMYYANS